MDKDRNSDPGVAGAMDVDPDIFVPDEENLEASKRGVVFELPKSGMTDLDFDMFTDGDKAKSIEIDVRPVAMAYEEFYCGFTADSHPAFSCTPISGKMERRNGPPTTVTVTCEPRGQRGELKAWLCFILPDEKMFSTFYQITCQAR